jgi:hypothetical protein
MTEGDAAIHTAGGLVFQVLGGERKDVLFPILHTLRGGALVEIFSLLLHESGRFSHFFLNDLN